MSKISIPTITSGYESVTKLNENFQDLEDELNEKVLYRNNPTGEPNQMENDLDMNGHRILNILSTTGGDNFIWMGAWTTGTSYSINNLVYEAGSTYICVEDHTSGTFATDLTAGKWEVFALVGSTGGGTGDLLAANNLSELVVTAATARANLSAAQSGSNSDITALNGLTTQLSVSQGGTGATTLTANNVLLGNGTSAVQFVAPGTSGNVLTSDGTTWTSSAATGAFTQEVGPLLSLSLNNYTSARTYSIAHTLGVVPKGYSIRLQCIVADLNWSIGDEVDIIPLIGAGTQTGSSWCNATYVGFTTTSLFSTSLVGYIANKTTGVVGGMTASRWKIAVYAWA